MKSLLLYLDEPDEPDGHNTHKLILEKFPEKRDIFEITEEQQDTIEGFHRRIKSNFSIRDNQNSVTSNLTRINQLPKKCTDS